MLDPPSPSDPEARPDAWRGSPVVWAAGSWVIGTILGRAQGGSAGWLALAAAGLLVAGLARWGGRWRIIELACAVSIVAVAAAWWGARIGDSGAGPRANAQRRLVELEGVIEEEPYIRVRTPGAMGRFDYRPPRTRFVLRADQQFSETGTRPIRAGVLVGIPAYDGRLHGGDRVRCTGWLTPIRSPQNPGEADFAARMAHQGVNARLFLDGRGNCRIVDRSGSIEPGDGVLSRWGDIWASGRRRLILGARRSLRAGMGDAADEPTAALLGVLLLGERRGDLGDLDEAFRRAGLAHLLAISGLHLGILALGVWTLSMMISGRPVAASAATLGVIALYLMIVPPRVPIIRAGIMTAAACWALTRGRSISPFATLALAALVLLIWRPGDLFTAGFQLSFLVVAGLVAFTPRVSQWIAPRPLRGASASGDGFTLGAGWRGRLPRKLVDWLSVSVVAWSISMPLVAYHFHTVHPLAFLMSVVMLPLVMLVLWLGYVKILLTAAWPLLGSWLAGPVLGLGDLTAGLARWAGDLPAAVLEVPTPTPAWAATALAVVAACLAGRFTRRPGALAAAAGLCLVWLLVPNPIQPMRAEEAALRLNMFSVGDGSCYLLRSGGEAMMFDCGSSGYLDITTVAIAPALHALNVRHVDTLVLSHPDLDHFSGSVELIDAYAVDRVLTTAAFLEKAARAPHSAAGFLIKRIRERGVSIRTIRRGWRGRLGMAKLHALWPPAGRRFERTNDGSLALMIEAAGRRVLLSGDAGREAMTAMLDARIDVRADVAELPHHGSFVPAATSWLAAVNPAIVLQSSGPARLRNDPWEGRLGGATRHITARHGMVELVINGKGEIRSDRFLDPADDRR